MPPKKNPIRFGVLAAIILLAAASRFIGANNFAPIGALALFGGAYFGRSWAAFLIPLLALWVSDWVVNYLYFGKFNPFYAGFYWQHLAFALVVLLGSVVLKRVKPLRVRF